jgi:hypothetical protein
MPAIKGMILGSGVGDVVKDGRKLRAMSKGKFQYPVNEGHPYVDESDNSRRFEYKNAQYEIKYFSGCFFPFVVKMS